MPTSGETLVTVATYNEMENLPGWSRRFFAYVPEVDILVIDDNSPDGTGAVVRPAAGEEPAARAACTARQAGPGHRHHRRHEICHRAWLPARC